MSKVRQIDNISATTNQTSGIIRIHRSLVSIYPLLLFKSQNSKQAKMDAFKQPLEETSSGPKFSVSKVILPLFLLYVLIHLIYLLVRTQLYWFYGSGMVIWLGYSVFMLHYAITKKRRSGSYEVAAAHYSAPEMVYRQL